MNIHIPTNKLIFALVVGVIFCIVANPALYKLVGNILGMEEYDNPNKSDRYYLLGIHSVVMTTVVFVLLIFYTPFTVNHKGSQ